MPQNIALANAAKSSIRAAVEHVFAHQTNRFGLFIRTIGIARAKAKLFLVKITYNVDRLIFHERARAAGSIRLQSGNPRRNKRSASNRSPQSAATDPLRRSNRRFPENDHLNEPVNAGVQLVPSTIRSNSACRSKAMTMASRSQSAASSM